MLFSFALCFGEEELPIKIYGEAAVVADLTTGDVLFTKNAYQKMYPASTTKMMTCILALENLDLNSTITVDGKASGLGGNTLNLKTGERFLAKDLLYGTMIESANDGAMAIALAVAGNEEDFAAMMNKKADEIGCTNTHFVNPHGLHNDNHYSTAYDLFLIARYCMQNETFRDIVSTVSYTIPATNMTSETRVRENTNWLLNNTTNSLYVNGVKRLPKYDGCIGIKTGMTNKAGNCLVAAAKRNNTTIIAVTLKAPGPYERVADGIALLDLGFNTIKTEKPLSKGTELGTIKVKRGSVKTVNALLDSDVFATLKMQETADIITSKVELNEELTAPVSKGAIVGKVSVFKAGTLVGDYNAVAANDVPKGGPLSVFGIDDATAAKIGKVIKIILIILVILVVLFAAWVVYEKEKVRRKKARKAARLKAKQEAEKKIERIIK